MQQVLLGMQCMQSMAYGGLRAVPSPACSSRSTPRLAAEFSAMQVGGSSSGKNSLCFIFVFVFAFVFVFFCAAHPSLLADCFYFVFVFIFVFVCVSAFASVFVFVFVSVFVFVLLLVCVQLYLSLHLSLCLSLYLRRSSFRAIHAFLPWYSLLCCYLRHTTEHWNKMPLRKKKFIGFRY